MRCPRAASSRAPRPAGPGLRRVSVRGSFIVRGLVADLLPGSQPLLRDRHGQRHRERALRRHARQRHKYLHRHGAAGSDLPSDRRLRALPRRSARPCRCLHPYRCPRPRRRPRRRPARARRLRARPPVAAAAAGRSAAAATAAAGATARATPRAAALCLCRRGCWCPLRCPSARPRRGAADSGGRPGLALAGGLAVLSLAGLLRRRRQASPTRPRAAGPAIEAARSGDRTARSARADTALAQSAA